MIIQWIVFINSGQELRNLFDVQRDHQSRGWLHDNNVQSSYDQASRIGNISVGQKDYTDHYNPYLTFFVGFGKTGFSHDIS